MKPQQVAAAYDQITHLWQQDSFNRNNGIRQHQQALAFVKTRGKALDVGCGCSGRFLDLLVQQGFAPEGLDLSPRMLQLAQQRHPQLQFWLADLVSWQPQTEYDFISAWDCLWHIQLTDQAAVLQKLLGALTPGGVLIFSAGGTDQPGEHNNSFMGPELYYASLGLQGYLKVITEQGAFCRHLEYDQLPEQHCWFVVQKPA